MKKYSSRIPVIVYPLIWTCFTLMVIPLVLANIRVHKLQDLNLHFGKTVVEGKWMFLFEKGLLFLISEYQVKTNIISVKNSIHPSSLSSIACSELHFEALSPPSSCSTQKDV